MNETQFKEKVLKDLKQLPGCWFIKTMERGRCGTPDLFICLKGRFIAIELKREGGKTTLLQQLTLSRIQNAGGLAFESHPSAWSSHLELLKVIK